MSESVVRERALTKVGSILRGKWTLEELVGLGGMAAVYRARHRNGALVAIKLLHPTLAGLDDVRRRFIGEGYAANRIAHPSVVRVLDDDVDDKDVPFLVMDYVEGQTLADAIEKRCFGDDELLDVAEQVCGALAAAHAAGVVHRDLKPDNLLVEPNGRVRILDFGIARVLCDDELSFFATKTGIAFGTPGFISPEQALGHRAAIGPPTDLFALGATLFYLATGRFLHATESAQELLILVATRPARLLRDVAPQISEEVAAIVDRATRLHIEERWESAEAMLEAIRKVRRARRASLPPERRPSVPPPGAVLAVPRSSVPTRRISVERIVLPTISRTSLEKVARPSALSRPSALPRPSVLHRARTRRSRVLALTAVAVLLSFAFVPLLFGAPRVVEAAPSGETASACVIEARPAILPEVQSPTPPAAQQSIVEIASIAPVIVVADATTAPAPKPKRPPVEWWRPKPPTQSNQNSNPDRLVQALRDSVKPFR